MKRKVALGPGAASLILIVVVLALCMMAMLTQISARNDYNLCKRSAEMVQRVYELNAQSEQKIAELDTVLVKAQAEAGSDMEAYLEKVEELLPDADAKWEDAILVWQEALKLNKRFDPAIQGIQSARYQIEMFEKIKESLMLD